jgi:hypothetical protein
MFIVVAPSEIVIYVSGLAAEFEYVAPSPIAVTLTPYVELGVSPARAFGEVIPAAVAVEDSTKVTPSD